MNDSMNEAPSNSDNGNEDSLTGQQRNLLLSEPISKLSVDKVIMLKDKELYEYLDLSYLCLSALDFVMEYSVMEAGATRKEIIKHIAEKAARMKPSLDDSQARKLGQIVLDNLSNAREDHKAFRSEYYDSERNTFLFHDFRLLTLFPSDENVVKYKLAQGGQILTLAMLNISPQFEQEADEIMLKEAIKRGRFKDALFLAKRARSRSAAYKQFIDTKLFEVKRSIDSVNWSKKVLPELDVAREHIEQRKNHEDIVIDKIRELLDITNERETKIQLNELTEIIEECREWHGRLYNSVITASEKYRELQSYAFQSIFVANLPNIEDEILTPLLSTSIQNIASMGDDVCVIFSGPKSIKLLDMEMAFEMLTEPVSGKDDDADDTPDDIVLIENVPTVFDEETEKSAIEWISAQLKTKSRLDMINATSIAREQGLNPVVLRCVLFLMLRSWNPEEDIFGVIADIDGTISTQEASGDNLLLTAK